MGKASRKKQNQRNNSTMKPVYWHGGRGELQVGDTLIPGNNFDDALSSWHNVIAEDKDVDSPQWVFFTTDRDMAYDYAREVERKMPGATGSVYRVAPAGTPNPDPDYHYGFPGLSWRSRRAQILAVDQVGVRLSDPIGSGHLYQTWDDGSRMYTDSGHAEPTIQAKALGFTSADLVHLGVHPHWSEINAALAKLVEETYPNRTEAQLREIARTNGFLEP